MTARKIKYVYVAGPLTSSGVLTDNVRRACAVADRLMGYGYVPFVPHPGTILWGLVSPKSYEAWLQYDFEWIEKCDALLRLPGHSLGADREEAVAHGLGIPVFYSIEALRHADRGRGKTVRKQRNNGIPSHRQPLQGPDRPPLQGGLGD